MPPERVPARRAGAPPAVKVCGVTVPEDARACAALGVWAVGVVFAPGSPRRVDERAAAAVCAALPDDVARVGVFVDAAPAEMAALAGRVGLTHLQVHGATDPAEARAASGLPVIAGVRVDGPAALDRARASAADLVLLDAAVPGLHGGTGTPFDWSLLEDDGLGRPYGLAGGLRAETVGEALERLAPVLVDVSSGVEASPGRKDHDRLRAFLGAVGDAGRRAA
ncbi:phosphoribosylanthranilate isomerase [Miltoncostaea marina]|uniref:phosphoribosylanthranilate isomerase n=1 Tax=Miltoncostaea marina TaxID=2843215 RepID=UPI001C3C8DC4|nr:phosphoribosylanthranilate isomerase [Miltoncostaea marina]